MSTELLALKRSLQSLINGNNDSSHISDISSFTSNQGGGTPSGIATEYFEHLPRNYPAVNECDVRKYPIASGVNCEFVQYHCDVWWTVH